MSDFNPEAIIQIWESHHGKLDDQSRIEFLRDPAMDLLVTFKWLELDVCIAQESTLAGVLHSLLKGVGYDEGGD